MSNDPGRDNTVSTARGPACGYPVTGSIDPTERAQRGDQYAARHDGFAFFRSITTNPAFCAAHIRPGTVSAVQYNHYSLLRTIEDIFGLPHLGDAAMPQVRSFGADIFG
jgi:hypothetical protein